MQNTKQSKSQTSNGCKQHRRNSVAPRSTCITEGRRAGSAYYQMRDCGRVKVVVKTLKVIREVQEWREYELADPKESPLLSIKAI